MHPLPVNSSIPRATARPSNICLTGIASIGAKLAERSEKQVL